MPAGPATTPSPARGGGFLRSRPRRLGRLRRALLVRRRLLAAVVAALAVLTTIRAAAAPPVATTPVVVAGEDLAGGATLSAGDLELRGLPAGAVPDGSVTDPERVSGRVLAAPLRRGEPVTDVRLVTADLLDGYPGTVAAPVRIADPAVAALLQVGDRIDLVATSPETGSATVVAHDVPVVALPDTTEESGGGASGLQLGTRSGGLLLVAVDREVALDLAGASATAVLSVLVGR